MSLVLNNRCHRLIINVNIMTGLFYSKEDCSMMDTRGKQMLVNEYYIFAVGIHEVT